VYIPQIEAKHKEWGELSGIKVEICTRNYEIKQKFDKGITISELAIEYCLAEETIKRIVYSKKNNKKLSGIINLFLTAFMY
jgi:Mor family transcriptional regulator